MIPKDLGVFDAVVRAGSIRKASQQMGVAPSSISRKIAIIERQFGTLLFDRSSDGVVLTHAGELVAEYARAAVLDAERLRADLDDFRGVRRRLIHVVTVESFASGRSLEAVERFRRHYDSVSFRFTVLPAPKVPEVVCRGECDIGVAFCSTPHPKIALLERIPEPIILAARPDHPIARAAFASLKDMTRYPVALPEAGFHVRVLFDQLCHAANLEIKPTLTCNTFEPLRDFVRCGAGLAVLPKSVVARDQRLGEIVVLPWDVAPLNDTTLDILVGKRRLPRVVRLFADELHRTITRAA